MAMATATKAVREVAYRSASEMREVLGKLFATADRDELIGPLLRAAHARTRFEFTDLKLAVNVASKPDDARHAIEWDFSARAPWPPKLTFTMASAVANSYLQGRESLPVLIARGRVRCKADSRAALLFLPTARLLVKPYRELVEHEYPHLVIR
jgi:hypothetical protein